MKQDATPESLHGGASLLQAYRSLKEGNAVLGPDVLERLYVEKFKAVTVPPIDSPRTFTKVTLVDPTIRTVISTATSAV